MSFTLIWTNKSKKDLKKIDKKNAIRIFSKIIQLENRETVFLEKLITHNIYKVKIGNYRALIEKHPALKKLTILRIGHRKNIYKKI